MDLAQTPAFMPVGTQATVKTLLPEEVAGTGAQIILANTYHLMLRPGPEVLRRAGGLHRFMGWSGPILTDSGGFQVFSLAHKAKVAEDGVSFRSHIDGDRYHLSPERAIALQLAFGSDIVMALDHFVGCQRPGPTCKASTERTHRWLDRASRSIANLTVIVEVPRCSASVREEWTRILRRESAATLAVKDVAGCAIGGLSVGEPKPVMAAMLEASVPELPMDKPRYLMGVGSPEDLWECVSRGVDLFDCVLPTRLARNGAMFTPYRPDRHSAGEVSAIGTNRSIRRVIARPARRYTRHISIISLRPKKSWACAWRRRTTYAFWRGRWSEFDWPSNKARLPCNMRSSLGDTESWAARPHEPRQVSRPSDSTRHIPVRI